MGLLSVLKQYNVIYVIFGITFLTSGLIINFFQCLLYFGLRPFSAYHYRKINYYLCYSLYSQLAFVPEWWSGLDIVLYMNMDDVEKFKKNHKYILMNHRYEIDWLCGWIICERTGVLGNCKAYVKKSLQYIPILGWAWRSAEYIFMERNWEKDKEVITLQIKELVNYPDTISLLLCAEGTRFTAEKLEASQKFAQKANLPVLNYHLTPRTKGFVASLPHMRGKISDIYDMQLQFKSDDPVKPTLTNLLQGKRITAYMCILRIPLEEVPEDEKGAEEWLHKHYEKKSLRCRSENQQIDVQFQKVLNTCRNRYAGSNTGNGEDSISTEDKTSGSDSRSEEEVYDNNFFDKNDSGPSYNQSTNNQRYRNSDRNSNTNTYSSDRSIKGNVKDFQNIKHIRKTNDRGSWNSRDSRNRKSDFNNGEMNDENTRFNNNTDLQQDCIVQCFFNELYAVDQKGFPEKDLVIPLMIQSIQDPELKNFVEESIIECFRYLEANKREKCEYSQNLLTCLAEKGQQKCEDWEN